MATASWNPVEERQVSLEEYLRTPYRPDCDFIDGILEERNVGEYEHSRIQLMLAAFFFAHEAEWKIIAVPECRLQVSEKRFRVPDLMVLLQPQKVDRIVRQPPLLCIEVLSPEDTWARMRARLNDYLTLGVENIWCFDPDAREARRYTPAGFVLATEPELTVPNTPIRLSIAEVFAALEPRTEPQADPK